MIPIADTILLFKEIIMPDTIQKENLYQENRIHSSALVPFSYYESRIPDYFPYVSLHWHREFEINFIRSGQSRFIVGDNQFTAETGDIIIIQPNMLHAVYQYENSTQIYDTVVFCATLLRGAAVDRSMRNYIEPLINGSLTIPARISVSHERYSELRSCIEHIVTYAQKNTALHDLFLKSALFYLFALLADSGILQHNSRCRSTQSEIIRPAIEYINDHYNEKLTIAQLAKVSSLSKSYFMYCFRKYAGISAIEYINQLRIKTACGLLTAGDRTISEIAYACGFSNLSNFNRQFRSQTGLSPTELRNGSKITCTS